MAVAWCLGKRARSPEQMRGVRSRSISFLVNLLRTLLRNGAIATPFSSITSALFLVQRRGGGVFLSPVPSQPLIPNP